MSESTILTAERIAEFRVFDEMDDVYCGPSLHQVADSHEALRAEVERLEGALEKCSYRYAGMEHQWREKTAECAALQARVKAMEGAKT